MGRIRDDLYTLCSVDRRANKLQQPSCCPVHTPESGVAGWDACSLEELRNEVNEEATVTASTCMHADLLNTLRAYVGGRG
jgi:hypothetical protein